MATINRLVWWEQTYNRALPTMRHPPLHRPGCGWVCGVPGWVGKIVRDVLFALMQADFLIATDLRDAPARHRHSAEAPSTKVAVPIEGIRRDTVHPGRWDVAL